MSNLCILCRDCHRKLEPLQHRGIRGVSGLGTALRSVAPFYLLCDVRDVDMSENLAQGSAATHAVFPQSVFDTSLAAVFMYENFLGGMGFNSKLYDVLEDLLDKISSRIQNCECDRGCAACVGPTEERKFIHSVSDVTRKNLTLGLVMALQEEPKNVAPCPQDQLPATQLTAGKILTPPT